MRQPLVVASSPALLPTVSPIQRTELRARFVLIRDENPNSNTGARCSREPRAAAEEAGEPAFAQDVGRDPWNVGVHKASPNADADLDTIFSSMGIHSTTVGGQCRFVLEARPRPA